jgi:hypothetical protein
LKEFDVDQRNRETVLLTKEEHIQELIARLGDAPEQQKVLAELAQEQERHILERDKRIILMERAQEDMAELTAKVSDEAKAAREAADAAEARAVAAEARHGASLEEAAGRLLQEARSRVLELESALSLAHEAQIKLEKSHATMAQVSYHVHEEQNNMKFTEFLYIRCVWYIKRRTKTAPTKLPRHTRQP